MKVKTNVEWIECLYFGHTNFVYDKDVFMFFFYLCLYLCVSERAVGCVVLSVFVCELAT